MCGICGIAVPRSSDRRIDLGVLKQMRDSLFHRGPDEAGVFLNGRVALGHRRLSIVDLTGGHQPMANEDNTVWVVFNGEIYNHRSLRPRLEAQGHRYRSECDTETILHLYEEKGWRVVDELRGMFAFAIWDSSKNELLLARDRLGIKPLYYVLNEQGVIHFASEIKALIAAGAVKPELNYNALPDYAANRATSGEDTLFSGVKRLMPGHVLVWRDGFATITRYWDLSFEDLDDCRDEEYVDQFYELFKESVGLRLMADVPLGMFLSGGIDSSAIAAVMSELTPNKVKTFSVAFEEREANEFVYAREVARVIGADHHEVTVSPEEFFESLPAMIYQEDEPLAHPSSIPLYFVSRLAAESVKVVLTGEGSDELLAGYSKYPKTIYNLALSNAYRRVLPSGARRSIKRFIAAAAGLHPSSRRLSRTFLALDPDIESIYFDNFAVFPRSSQGGLFTDEAVDRMSNRDPYSLLEGHFRKCGSESLLNKLLAADLKTYLHELLMKQDQMSMAASIESRVPFLDHKLVEFATRLPARLKLRGFTTKYVLRKAMRGRLPDVILSRRKMGFPVPVGRWLRGAFSHLLDEYVLSSRSRERGIFNSHSVEQLVARHRAGEDHSERLWMLMNFEIWQRRFLDGETSRSEERDSSATGALAVAI